MTSAGRDGVIQRVLGLSAVFAEADIHGLHLIFLSVTGESLNNLIQVLSQLIALFP